MKCPVCKLEKHYTCTNSHDYEGFRKRTYKCRKCGSSFHTKEIIVDFKTNVASTNDTTEVVLAGTNVLELRSMVEDLQKKVLVLERRVDTLSMFHG